MEVGAMAIGPLLVEWKIKNLEEENQEYTLPRNSVRKHELHQRNVFIMVDSNALYGQIMSISQMYSFPKFYYGMHIQTKF